MVGAVCCYGIFEIWSKSTPGIFQQVKNIGPRVPHGRPKSIQRGSPLMLRKTGRNKTRHIPNILSNGLQNGSRNLKVLNILGNIYRFVPTHFLDVVEMQMSIILGSILASFL